MNLLKLRDIYILADKHQIFYEQLAEIHFLVINNIKN